MHPRAVVGSRVFQRLLVCVERVFGVRVVIEIEFVDNGYGGVALFGFHVFPFCCSLSHQ